MNKLVDSISKDNENVSFYENSYFAYFLCTILKVLGLYILYKMYRRCKRKCCFPNEPTKCADISNCH